MTARKPAIVFDLDGTLADVSDRRQHLERDPPDWGSFFREIPNDRPNTPVVLVYKLFRDAGYPIIIASGRPEELAPFTLKWLRENDITFDRLFMRPYKDNRPDAEVKLDMLNMIREEGFEPMMVFDDRAKVVAMWRNAGIPTFQVAPGDF